MPFDLETLEHASKYSKLLHDRVGKPGLIGCNTQTNF